MKGTVGSLHSGLFGFFAVERYNWAACYYSMRSYVPTTTSVQLRQQLFFPYKCSGQVGSAFTHGTEAAEIDAYSVSPLRQCRVSNAGKNYFHCPVSDARWQLFAVILTVHCTELFTRRELPVNLDHAEQLFASLSCQLAQ